ncbi:hypothetical protein [Leifsonia sp. 1010]|uniref:hypothetical protein n=1 Tax=Leifsonia sp. 1010 TaxID=2817769 RepID=UPI0028582760|nr:hypothetical protein [Leifsonia sp. 1010]MDR6612793.1 hypothetical protein [Leifsonia sp. 1010]
MATTHDFFLTGDHEQGRRIVLDALRGQGFAVMPAPNGAFTVQRGSTAMTVLFGGLAGSQLRITFLLRFQVDQQGRLVARLSRDQVGAAVSGGAIGASKAKAVFEQCVADIGGRLRAAQLFAGEVRQ